MCLSDSNAANSAKCGSSAMTSHRHKAVLSPVALTPRMSKRSLRREATLAKVRLDADVRRQLSLRPQIGPTKQHALHLWRTGMGHR